VRRGDEKGGREGGERRKGSSSPQDGCMQCTESPVLPFHFASASVFNRSLTCGQTICHHFFAFNSQLDICNTS